MGTDSASTLVRITDPSTGQKADRGQVGISCPACGSGDTKVTDSRPGVCFGRGSIMRRRDCGECDHRWRTYEIEEAIVTDDLLRRDIAKDMIAKLLEMV